MIKYIKTFSFFTFCPFSMTCFPQNRNSLGVYTAHYCNNEWSFRLTSDSTYESKSLWGSSYGFYYIITDEKDSLYDRIILGDLIYGTKKAFHFYHVSISQEVVKALIDSNLYSKDSFYVAMYDLTGEFVTYYNVCFSDSIGNLLLCDYNEGGGKVYSIPMGTSSIGMTGERFNLATYFKSEYNRTQGSIAFVIGPSSDRFYIKKDRSCILYRPCYCDGYDSDCCVVFMKERREYQNGQ